MKTSFSRRSLCLATLAVALSAPTIYAACSMDGAAIMKKQEELHRVNYEFMDQVITLKDLKANVSEEPRALKRYKKDVGGEDKSFIAYLSPADIKGTALLTWKNNDREDDQWLYIPALRKDQRIAGGEKKKYFMGTDFTYADLESENLSDFNYKCLEEKNFGGKFTTFVVEATPKNSEIENRTGYSKRVLKVDTSKFVSREVDFYNTKGELLKTLTNTRWKKVSDNGAQRALKSVMTRPGEHETLVEVKEVKVNEKIDDVVFTQRYYLKGLHLQ